MFFLSNGLYGKRKWNHVDLYKVDGRWWFVEVGSRTLEIDLTVKKKDRKASWYMPTRLPFWLIVMGDTAARAAEVVESSGTQSWGYSAAWFGYFALIAFNLKGE